DYYCSSYAGSNALFF
nr:immunoglobulin light chain junction region [Macaca mulatta]MOV66041.1 immunoglobulin light chain junction region [Macaca mulatta]MOV66150.1 immunoglobulin light chain junction region [Macaca mulatta]MOV66182.1 immunoglobulin light chain junction region [Macaca mulatta]MOV66461.1 immunoglobulin light chain junction region [Macaca mulatta]